MNNPRTLSGVNGNTLEQIVLPSTKDAILIDGDEGKRGQVLAKNETTNKLEWDYVDDITIPDNSISGDKLKTDITFSTTGLIRANEFFSNYFIVPQNGTQQVILDSDGITMVGNLTINASNTELRIDNIICSGNGGTDPTILVQDGDIGISDGMLETFVSGTDAVRINNGGDIALYSDNSQNLTMRIDANSGTITILSNGKIQTYGTDEIMRILNGGDIGFYSDNLGNTPTLEIKGSNGQIEMKGGGNLEIKNGGDIELYDGNNDKRVELISADGDIKLYNSSGDNTIELDGSSDNINVFLGGNIRLYEDDPQPAIFINLDGSNGLISCRDINITNHSGTLNLNNIRCNDIGVPKTGTKINYMNIDGLVLTGEKEIDAPQSQLDIKNIVVSGGLTTPNSAIICLGGLETGTDSASNEGDILLNTGDLTITAGNFLQSGTSTTFITNSLATFKNAVDFRGNHNIDFVDGSNNLTLRINNSNGNITSASGAITLNKSGTTPPPTDGTYTDWAINISDNDGHQYIGGNLIVNGTIYGSVEGSITEEEVDCQRLTIRTATPPISGITGMILGSGAEITNDTSGNLELTIDADTSAITCNNISVLNNNVNDTALNVVGNVNLSTGGSRKTTIGNTGLGNQTFEVLCQNVNIGETAGNQQHNTLNYRGGIHTFTGEKVNIGDRLGYTNVGCSLEGSTGIGTNNIYKNEIKYFNINGRYISHNLAGTTQNFVIYRANTEKGVEVPSVPGFSGTSTSYLQPNSFSFVDLVAPTNACKITIQSFYRHYKGNPDLMCRIDETATGATPYSAQVGGPRIIKNSVNVSGNEQAHKYDFIISGLIEGNTYSFYPKYAHTTSGRGFLCYGGAFGEMYMYIEWLEFYNGVVKDPYSAIPTGEEILGETLHSLSYVDNESQNFTRIYNTSNKWIFDGNQDSGTDTLEAHFTATTTTGYIEFGFYANSLTAGMIFMCGIASATGGTSPFATTLTSSAVSIDAYKQGLFNGDTTQYSLKEILDFTSYENTYITSKFHFNNLTIGTEYKMALYGRCHNTGSIYINAGGKSGGTTNRNAHQQAFIKFYSYDSSLGGARTDDPYVGGDDY